MNLKQFLSNVDGVTRSTSGWIANCPAHDDHDYCLTANEKDGDVVVHCLDGCEPYDIFRAVEWRLGYPASWDDVPPEIPVEKEPPTLNNPVLREYLRQNAEQMRSAAARVQTYQAAPGSKPVAEYAFPSVLKTKTANEWIDESKERPKAKKLFGDLWFQEELCIFFGPTGKGKTALAVQIADSISSGRPIPGFELSLKGQKVLYLDCELSDKQFEGRYAEQSTDSDYYLNHYKFSDNFYRAEIDMNAAMLDSPGEFQEWLQISIGRAIVEHEITVLIVDNITWLRDETEKAKAALPLMKGLKQLKEKYHLSILALAHTPKRDNSRPITLNDLQGSAILGIFADTIFAMNASSKDPSLRYLKQLKIRSAEHVFGPENVKTCWLVKESNFLHFEFGDETSESDHLHQPSDQDLSTRRGEVARLLNTGATQRKIALELGISVGTVNRIVKATRNECSNRS